MSVPTVQILQGDCLDVLRRFPDEQFDLMVTSPKTAWYFRKRCQNGLLSYSQEKAPQYWAAS